MPIRFNWCAGAGDDQAAHADCEEPDGSPNQFPWRAFASIIYLNDEYEGGAIHFPNRPAPELKPGLLAYFPSTANYPTGWRKSRRASGLRSVVSIRRQGATTAIRSDGRRPVRDTVARKGEMRWPR